MGDVLAIGGPSALATWGQAMLRDAAGFALRPLEVVVLDRDDDPDLLPRPPAAPDRLLACQYPSAALLSRLRSGRLPTVAFIDDPYDCVRYHCRVAGAPLLDVIRAQSLAHTFIPFLAEIDESVVVRRDYAGSVGDLIRALLDRLQLSLSPERLRELIGRHTATGAADRLEACIAKAVGDHYAPLWEGLAGPTERRFVEQVLMPLRNAYLTREAVPIVWNRDLFMLGDRPNEPPPPVVEVTGGARVILYGPYTYLPPGRYEVTVLMVFSSEIVHLPFRMLCVQGPTLKVLYEGRFIPQRGGLHSAAFPLRHMQSNEYIQILIRTERGAIEGRISFLQASLAPGVELPAASFDVGLRLGQARGEPGNQAAPHEAPLKIDGDLDDHR